VPDKNYRKAHYVIEEWVDKVRSRKGNRKKEKET
jgi:hypothetical protein